MLLFSFFQTAPPSLRLSSQFPILTEQLAAAMASFHHRKLIFESFNNSAGKTCNYYCSPQENPSGACTLSCLYTCLNCKIPLFSEFEPPLPSFSIPSVPVPPSPDRRPVSLFVIILLSVISSCFAICSCFFVYRFKNSRTLQPQQQGEEEQGVFSDIADENHGPMLDHPIWYIRTVGLQPSVISAITICKYKRGDALVEGTVCSVCLSEFQEDETLRILPNCNHAFHIPCIDTWLSSHTNCPMCRSSIVIATTSTSPLLEQNSRLRHEGETSSEISESATQLRVESENNEGDSVDVSSMDISGNSKEDMGNGNGRELSEFYALRRSTSSESLSSASILTRTSDIANSSRQQSTDQSSSEESIEVSETELNSISFDGNESCSTGKGSLCLDRVLLEEQMRSLSCSNTK